MSEREPHRIYFELTEITADRAHPDFNRLSRQRHDFMRKLREAGVSNFCMLPFALIGMPTRWAEVPYGDPLEPAMRVFCEGVRAGEYAEFIDPRPVVRGPLNDPRYMQCVTYTKANVNEYK